jgi:hypothetical protein
MQYFQIGSEDSLDKDMLYVVDEIPSIAEAKKICDVGEENRNLIKIEDGIVVDCYKGSPDETNNALWMTYSLHPQDFPLPIERKVERIILLKLIRASRIVISYYSRTLYRPEVKAALRSYQTLERLKVLAELDFGAEKLSVDAYKSIAFQLGQCLALIEGEELYSKSAISTYFPVLEPYLKRMKTTDFAALHKLRDRLLSACEGLAIYSENGMDTFVLKEGFSPLNALHRQAKGLKVDVKAERLC